jgi:hypothetical protein
MTKTLAGQQKSHSDRGVLAQSRTSSDFNQVLSEQKNEQGRLLQMLASENGSEELGGE